MYRNLISDVQIYKRKQYKGWDPDSSPEAWNHYGVVNRNELVKLYGENYFLSKRGIRLRAGYYHLYEVTMGADTDFSFRLGSRPYNKFLEIIENDPDASIDEKDSVIKKVETCSKYHHSLTNFSLMPQTGGMNLFKCDYRFDRFIHDLNEFFRMYNKIREKYNELEQREITTMFIEKYPKLCPGRGKIVHKEMLVNYLATFKTLARYCEEMYFIDVELINKLIEFHEKVISENIHRALLTTKQVSEYCDLAEEYWTLREKKFEELYTINKASTN